MTPATPRPRMPLEKLVSGGEMERKRNKDVGTMSRGRTGDLKGVRNSLM